MKTKFYIIAACLFLLVGHRSGYSQGILGERFVSFGIGFTKPGDELLKDIDDTIFQTGGTLNLPLNKNIDSFFTLEYGKLDGDYYGTGVESSTVGFVGGIRGHFLPGKKVDPFLSISGGFFRTKMELSEMGFKLEDDEDDFGFSVSGGVEIEAGEKIAFRQGVGYVNIGDVDDVIIGSSLTAWLNKSVFSELSVSYGFDEGDIAFIVGLGFKF